MTDIREVPIMYPPAQQGMLYGGKGSVEVIADNVTTLFDHAQNQRNDLENLRGAIAEKFEEMERRIKDATTLMFYVQQFYPQVVTEWSTAQHAKQRIGVGDGPPK